MTVYVDESIHKFGRMTMCHMVADTQEELLEMATLIGVNHKWIQKRGTAHEHFDISKGKRALAITHGAKPVTRRELGEILRSKRDKQI